MSPKVGRIPAIASRFPPQGAPIGYPVCGDWTCDDEEDWDVVASDDEEYAAVKRERSIVYYHEPRAEWRARLQQERDARSDGDPLWWGRRQD